MDREIIAEIRLAPGEVGYYDDYSRVYLSTTKPVAKIYAGMNTTQIRKSIRSGRLRLISGSLFGPAPAVEPKVEPKKEKPIEVKTAEPAKEEPVEVPVPEEPVTFESVEPVSEEVTEEPEAEATIAAPEEETKPKRRRSRKKADAE